MMQNLIHNKMWTWETLFWCLVQSNFIYRAPFTTKSDKVLYKVPKHCRKIINNNIKIRTCFKNRHPNMCGGIIPQFRGNNWKSWTPPLGFQLGFWDWQEQLIHVIQDNWITLTSLTSNLKLPLIQLLYIVRCHMKRVKRLGLYIKISGTLVS